MGPLAKTPRKGNRFATVDETLKLVHLSWELQWLKLNTNLGLQLGSCAI